MDFEKNYGFIPPCGKARQLKGWLPQAMRQAKSDMEDLRKTDPSVRFVGRGDFCSNCSLRVEAVVHNDGSEEERFIGGSDCPNMQGRVGIIYRSF